MGTRSIPEDSALVNRCLLPKPPELHIQVSSSSDLGGSATLAPASAPAHDAALDTNMSMSMKLQIKTKVALPSYAAELGRQSRRSPRDLRKKAILSAQPLVDLAVQEMEAAYAALKKKGVFTAGGSLAGGMALLKAALKRSAAPSSPKPKDIFMMNYGNLATASDSVVRALDHYEKAKRMVVILPDISIPVYLDANKNGMASQRTHDAPPSPRERRMSHRQYKKDVQQVLEVMKEARQQLLEMNGLY